MCSWSDSFPPSNLSFNELSSSSSPQSLLVEVLVNSKTDLSGKNITCRGKYMLQEWNRNCTIIPESPSVSAIAMHASSNDSDGIVSVSLTFNGTFNPLPVIAWSGPTGQQLSAGGKYNLSSGNTTLTVYNFTLEQNLGNYSFNCSNPLGGKTQALNLTAPSVSSCNVTRSSDGRSAVIAWTVPRNAVLTRLVVQMQGTPLARATTTDWQDISSVGTGNGSFTVPGMDPSESYSFRVTPMFGNKSGTPSDAQTAKPTTLSPGAVEPWSPGAIAGIVVGSVLGFLLIVILLVLVICCIRKQKGRQGRRPPTPKVESDKKKSGKTNGSVVFNEQGQAGWKNASPSSTLTNGPGAYKTHNATFRHPSLSTISATVPSNSTAVHNNNLLATDSRRGAVRAATTV